MQPIHAAALVALGLTLPVHAGVVKTDTGVRLDTAQGTLVVEPWTARIIHVTAFRNNAWKGAYNPSVIAQPEKVDWRLKETDASYILSTAVLQVRIDRK